MKKISICIPAYKRPENVRRLLRSISSQTFTDYEVILTDDSPDDSVEAVVAEFPLLPLRYFRNEPARGTPANWNAALAHATGEWIKLMHDDDWFAGPGSLQAFADLTSAGIPFIFSRYRNVTASGETEEPPLTEAAKVRIRRAPLTLLARNVIGPPSVVLIHHSISERYDTFMKWRVDIDYYIRLLRHDPRFAVVETVEINVGISDSQVTNDCKDVPSVELPEGQLLLYKYGVRSLRNLRVYDAWWRILRNTGIRSERQLKSYTAGHPWPQAILTMVSYQRLVPARWLVFGPLSKGLMLLSYPLNLKNLSDR